jgi:hypothetical protein
MARRPQAALGLLMALFPATGLAIDEWESEDGDYTLELMGSERLFGAFLHYPDISLYPDDDDALVGSVTRLMMEGDLGEQTRYEVNAFFELTRMPPAAQNGAFATAGAFRSPYRTRYLAGRFWESGNLEGEGGLDRLAFTFDFDPVTLSLGRMPVNYSVTNIFTPNDFFAPFSVVAVNTVYKPGVDALRLAVTTGTFSSVELVGVLGSNSNDIPTWGRSALLLHTRTVLEEIELAILGGKLAERWVAGASMQAPIGLVNLRAEGHAGFPDTDGDFQLDDVDGDGRIKDGVHVRLSAGIDTLFTWHNTTLGIEYLYLSDGADTADLYLERAQHLYPDDALYLGRQYLAVSVGTEIIPILKVMAFAMLNAEDASGMFTWTFAYNISDEADFLLGLMVPWGRSPVGTGTDDSSAARIPRLRSEYGQSPVNVFLETRFYF